MSQPLVRAVQSLQPSRLLERVEKHENVVHTDPDDDKYGDDGEEGECFITEDDAVEK